MFYTQRRSFGYQFGVTSYHGTDIGIAVSKDGLKWLYRGIAEGLVIDWGRNTFWAPEVIFALCWEQPGIPVFYPTISMWTLLCSSLFVF